MNQFEFIRYYRQMANGHIEDHDLITMYKELRIQTFGLDLNKSFDSKRPDNLAQILAIDSIAHAIHKETRAEDAPVMEHIFPGADLNFFKKALDQLAGLESEETNPLANIRKSTRGYFNNSAFLDDGFVMLEKQNGHTTVEDISDAIAEYKRHFMAGIASPAEIVTLHRFDFTNEEYKRAVQLAGLDEENEPVVVGGPASVELIDRQGHLITTAALKVAFVNFMKNMRYRNVQLVHSDVQVAHALPAYINRNGDVYKSGVDDNSGFWLISELRTDTKIARKAIEQIDKGVLKSYSIAGTAGDLKYVDKGGRSFMQVGELELQEVTICEVGVNQGAFFNMLKSVESTQDNLEYALSLFKDTMSADGYGVVLEKAPLAAVIVADAANIITDQIRLQLEATLPPEIPVVVKSADRLGDYIPIYKSQMVGLWKEELKQQKEDVNFQPVSMTADKCWKCTHMQLDGTCELVEGTISSSSWCELFDQKEVVGEDNPFIETEVGTVTYKGQLKKRTSGRPPRPNLVASTGDPNRPFRWMTVATRDAKEVQNMTKSNDFMDWMEKNSPPREDLVPDSGDPQHPGKWVKPDTVKNKTRDALQKAEDLKEWIENGTVADSEGSREASHAKLTREQGFQEGSNEHDYDGEQPKPWVVNQSGEGK